METADPPSSAGIFCAAGSVVTTLRTAADQQTKADALVAEGIAAATIVPYGPAEMLAAIDMGLPNVGTLAPFGQELKIAEERRVLATEGCSFQIVSNLDNDSTAKVKATVNRLPAPTAQHHGWRVVEELTDRTSAEMQLVSLPVPASP